MIIAADHHNWKQYIKQEDNIVVKVVKLNDDGTYLGSMLGAYPNSNPLLEPNLLEGATWKGVISSKKSKYPKIRYIVDVFPNFYGELYCYKSDKAKPLDIGTIVNVKINSMKSFVSYSGHGNYCKATFVLSDDEPVYAPVQPCLCPPSDPVQPISPDLKSPISEPDSDEKFEATQDDDKEPDEKPTQE